MGAPLTAHKLALDKGKPKARPDCEDRFERSLLAGCEEPFQHDRHSPIWAMGGYW